MASVAASPSSFIKDVLRSTWLVFRAELVMEAMRADRRGADMDGSRHGFTLSSKTESLQFFMP